MNTHRLHAGFGAQQFFQRDHRFGPREAELRWELRISGSNSLSVRMRTPQRQFSFLASGSKAASSAVRIEVHRQFAQFETAAASDAWPGR
jgi:hypothetical protein